MNRLLIAIALLVPAAAPLVPAAPHQMCVPPPPRTTPRRQLDRVDKWQHDQRTIA